MLLIFQFIKEKVHS